MRMTENGMNVKKDLFRVRYTGKEILTYLLRTYNKQRQIVARL